MLLHGVGKLRAAFPGLGRICEDPVRGKLRLTAISGRKDNSLSNGVQRVNMAFFNTARPGEYRWSDTKESQKEEAEVAYAKTLNKITTAEARDCLDRALECSSTPTNYGLLLAAVGTLGAQDMRRSDNKGTDKSGENRSRTGADLLKAQLDHFDFLKNHATRPAEMTPAQRESAPCGTATSEAGHRAVGSLMSNINRQNLDLIEAKLDILLFGQIASSAARSYPTAGRGQARLVSSASAQILSCPGKIQIEELDEAALSKKTTARKEASARERKIQEQIKQKKLSTAKKRGIVLPPAATREAGRILRALARQRSLSKRARKFKSSMGILTKSALRSARWGEALEPGAEEKKGTPKKPQEPSGTLATQNKLSHAASEKLGRSGHDATINLSSDSAKVTYCENCPRPLPRSASPNFAPVQTNETDVVVFDTEQKGVGRPLTSTAEKIKKDTQKKTLRNG